MSEQAKPKILGTGLVALDLVVSADVAEPVKSWAGGTCGNVLAILAWLGWDSYPIARMNGDAASSRVRADLSQLGVNLALASCEPVCSTPIVVQEIRTSEGGVSSHRFSWSCLRCGGYLPAFKPVTRAVVDQAAPYIEGSAVFFFDRASRAAVEIARTAGNAGAVVMFEPSGRGDPKLFAEALGLAHIVKYSDQRMAEAVSAPGNSNLWLEIQTLGSKGLRFRMPKASANPGWMKLAAAQADVVVDSCGSGDWTTAGLLSRLASHGRVSLMKSTTDDVVNALNYGQALAAWNCAFEGARGGMYTAPLTAPVAGLQLSAVSTTLLSDDFMRVDREQFGCPKCVAA